MYTTIGCKFLVAVWQHMSHVDFIQNKIAGFDKNTVEHHFPTI